MAAVETWTIRPFGQGDLPSALALQALIYPNNLKEAEPAFASHLNPRPSYCLTGVVAGKLAGYLLAHGWRRDAPPAIGMVVSAGAWHDVLYIHDLAVAPNARGTGLGRALAKRAIILASRDGIRKAELVAVEGADRFWASIGFRASHASSSIAEKVDAYGPMAKWMCRAI
jgi:GNAT superfamily N-acetyltransferase